MRRKGFYGGAWAAMFLVACSGPAPKMVDPPAEAPPRPAVKPPPKKTPVAVKKGGGYYKDDGPGEEVPDNLDEIPDAVPKWEPIHKPASKPYIVLGKEYVPHAALRPYKVRGIASWYGRKFHGLKTSIGEPYDMFAMTAAHPTLVIPSYVRVTSLQSGKSVIVRVIDRGPFHSDRVIDLSYTAAWKLGLIDNGSGQVEVETILPGENAPPLLAQTNSAAVPGRGDEIEELARRLPRDEAPPPAADTGAPRGIYLQLGAFANADNAESLRNHLSRELDWVSEPMRINLSGGIHRLQLGPYASRADAGRIAEKIRLALGYKPTIVSR